MAYNAWNWMLKDWPQFSYDAKALEALEYQFSENSGTVFGVLKHLREESKDNFLVEVLSDEAIKTSEIEGEYLNRESVQSSIKKNFGLAVEKRKIPPAEFGISEMMVDLYLNYDLTLTHEQLFSWHKMICNGRRDIKDIGCYRTHEDPMQLVSGRLDLPKVHFEAPPSKIVPDEMERFVSWFNQIHQKDVNQKLLPLTKAGIAHLYFVSIHPFEDGNGRIGRAIAEKSIAQSTLRPSLISLSSTIDANKKSYYAFLEKSNTTLEITDWLVYFSETILEAQEHTLKRIDFLIEKIRFFDRFSSQLNERQLKVVKRLFDAGHKGFKGGLSANNYQTIAKASASTATRDLQDLINKQILIKTGTLKSTRYFLKFEPLKSSI
ncbi:Fic family protein [uncultured Draconibacterium sp.]|uniref:Fic family protein n=1 Tax=uncultured Draconibacterium sp. TaxID=1573823 RepID=UPI003260A9F1